LNFSKPTLPSHWQQQQQPQAFTPSFQSAMQPPSHLHPGAVKSTPFSLNDLSIRSVSSNASDVEGDGTCFLRHFLECF